MKDGVQFFFPKAWLTIYHGCIKRRCTIVRAKEKLAPSKLVFTSSQTCFFRSPFLPTAFGEQESVTPTIVYSFCSLARKAASQATKHLPARVAPPNTPRPRHVPLKGGKSQEDDRELWFQTTPNQTCCKWL